jgi:hypothetical protein
VYSDTFYGGYVSGEEIVRDSPPTARSTLKMWLIRDDLPTPSYMWISGLQEASVAEHQPSPGRGPGIYQCAMLNENFGLEVTRTVALPLA